MSNSENPSTPAGNKTVFCTRLKKEAPALVEAPMPGKLGQEILSKVSEEAWNEWREMQLKIVNEYRLDLSEKEHRKILAQQMRSFLGLDGDAQETMHVGTPTY